MVVGDEQVGHREQGGVPGFHAGDGEVGEEENVQRKARMNDHLERKVKISHMIPSERQKNKFAHMIPADQEKTSTPHFDLGMVEMVVKK